MARRDRVADSRFFDGIASRYDAHRPTYPGALLDRACEIAGLRPGDRVLEIGSGSGHLTVGLVARDLTVTAVEPGANLLEIARAKTPEVEFRNATLEEAGLPPASYRAAFAASAIHWPDPDVSWRLLAEALAPGGTLALISFFGLAVPADDRDAQLRILRDVAPGVYGPLPDPPTREHMDADLARHRGNISTAWQPYTLNDITRDYAADLFDDAELDVLAERVDQTAAEVVDELSTMSFARLPEAQRLQIAARLAELERDRGRPLRTTRACLLMSARRADADGQDGARDAAAR